MRAYLTNYPSNESPLPNDAKTLEFFDPCNPPPAVKEAPIIPAPYAYRSDLVPAFVKQYNTDPTNTFEVSPTVC